jgi:hypothetical protein
MVGVMIYTDISQRKIYNGTIHSFSGELDDKCSIQNLLREEGFWSSKKHHSMERDFFIVDFGEELPFTFVEMHPSGAASCFLRLSVSRRAGTAKPGSRFISKNRLIPRSSPFSGWIRRSCFSAT